MFDGIIANFFGEGLHEPSKELIGLLTGCPTNRNGQHYLQQVIDDQTYTFHLRYFGIGDMALKVNGFAVYDTSMLRWHPRNRMIRPHRLDDGTLVLVNGAVCSKIEPSINDPLILRLQREHPTADQALLGYLARIIELLDVAKFYDGEYIVTAAEILDDLAALYPKDMPINNSLGAKLQAALA